MAAELGGRTGQPVVPTRLLDALDVGMTAPIQLVRAGAGWGKTTLVRQWLDRRRSDAWSIWIGLDYAVEATDLVEEVVRGSSPGGPAVSAIEAGAPASADAAQLGVWASRIVPQSFGVIVVDDVDAFMSDSAIEFLGTFLTRLPDSCHVVLSGRRIPPRLETHLGLAFMPALVAANLALTPDETRETVESLLGVECSEEALADLTARTDGWAAGIMSAVRIAQDPAGPATLDTRNLHRVLAAYFEREVLSQVSLEARRLMLEMSVVNDDIHQALLRALTGTDSTRALAGALDASGGFLSVRSPNEHVYHLLPVLGAYLRDEFEQSRPTRAQALHRRAALWYEEQGSVSRACRHAIAAGETGLAIRFCGHYWLSYARSGRESTIRSWLEWIREAAGADDPTVSFVRGWLAGMRGRTPELERGLEVLASRPSDQIAGGPTTARAGLLILRAAFIDHVGVQGAQDAREALLELDRDSVWWTIAQCLLGYHLYWTAQLDEAREVLMSGVAAADRALVPVSILQMAFGILGLIDASRRYAPGARENAGQALRLTESAGLGTTSLAVPALVAQALGDAAAGQLDEAAAQLDVAARNAERDRNGRHLALAYLATSRVRHLQGDRAGAESMLRAAQALLDDLPEAAVLHAEAEVAARMMRLRPRRMVAPPDEPTPRELRVLELLAAGLSRSDIAEQLGVSTDTVKTHIRNLYMKLDADSREAAIDRARALGILKPEPNGAAGTRRSGVGNGPRRVG